MLVAARVDREGRVLDAIAVHTAMSHYQITDKLRDRLVRLFGDESIKAMKQWRYPTSDAGAPDEATVFTQFAYRNEKMPHFSEGWRAPNKPIPWLPAGKQEYDVVGLKEGESLALDSRIKLNTQVVGTNL